MNLNIQRGNTNSCFIKFTKFEDLFHPKEDREEKNRKFLNLSEDLRSLNILSNHSMAEDICLSQVRSIPMLL